MKLLFKMFKPYLKKILLGLAKQEEDRSINFIEAQVMRINLPISGEQLDQVVKVCYESLETIILNKIDQI